MKTRYMFSRMSCVALGSLACALVMPAAVAADTSGLDLTIQVIGAQDPVSEGAHRIPVPGVLSGSTVDGLLSGAAKSGSQAPAPPLADLQQGLEGVLQNPVQGTVNTVESLTGGILGTLGLTPKPEQ